MECHVNGISIVALRRQDTSYPQFLILCKVTSLILERPFHIVRQNSIRHFCGRIVYNLQFFDAAYARAMGVLVLGMPSVVQRSDARDAAVYTLAGIAVDAAHA